jgi:WD40 repeat protein
VVRRNSEDGDKVFEREYKGILNYEPISRQHASLMGILHVGRNDAEGFFYYIMELADDFSAPASPGEFTPKARSLEYGQKKITDQQPANEDGCPQSGRPRSAIANPETYVPHTLREQLKRLGQLSFEQCIGLGLALTSALDQLHGQGLTHRDVKPSNIVFVDGRPKLADIGLVARTDGTRSVVGTLGYVPPEGAGSPQADLFSLGKVLYEASTGKDREDFPEPATYLENSDVEAWAEYNEIILRACAPEVDQRYRSARQMREDLLRLQAGGSIRRLRQTERRLAVVKKVGAVVGLITLIVGLGLLYQLREARRFKMLAQENVARLRQAHIANGIRAMDEGQMGTSLVWLTEALRLTPAGSPDEKTQRRRWEAVWQQCPRVVRLGVHRGPIWSVKLSPNGRFVLTASDDNTACLWELATGQLVLTLPHEQSVKQAAFSGDGKNILTVCEDFAVRVWDASTGHLCLPPLRHEAKVLWAAFSPDGKRIVTCAANGAAHLWNGETGESVAILRHRAGEVNFADFSPDGRCFVTAGDDCTTRVWETYSGKTSDPPLEHPDHVRQARYGPDGQRIVTACRDGNARIWSAKSGQLLTPPLKHRVPLLFALFSHDGQRVLAGGGDDRSYGEARVWHTITGEPAAPEFRSTDLISQAVFSPDDRIVATASRDFTTRLWQVETGALLDSPLPHNNAVKRLCFTAAGHQILTAGLEGVWRLWELAAGHALDPTFYHRSPVGSAAFDRDQTHAVISSDVIHGLGAVCWNIASGKSWELGDPADKAIRAVFSPDRGCLAIFYTDGTAKIHDAKSGKPLRALSGYDLVTTLSAECFSPDGKLLLVSGKTNFARLWQVDNGQPVSPALVNPYRVCSLAFSSDSRFFAIGSGDPQVSGKGEVRVYSSKTSRPVGPIIALDGPAMVLVFNPDGGSILIGCGGNRPESQNVRYWDIHSGQAIGPPIGNVAGIDCATFSRDGRRMITANQTIRIWDAKTAQPLSPYIYHHRGINDIKLTADDRYLASASGDGTARIWDAFTGEAVSPPLKHGDFVRSAEFSANGEALLTSS